MRHYLHPTTFRSTNDLDYDFRRQIIVQTPNMASLGAGFSRYIELTHVTGFSENSSVEMLELTGFDKVSTFGSKTAVCVTPSRLL